MTAIRSATPASPPSSAGSGPPVRAAARHHRPGWRDPRILVGLVILAGSMLLGAKVLAGSDDTVGVWALGRDLPSGTRVTSADVQRVQIRFAGGEQADRYLSADDPLPTDAVLGRAVGQGEMLPRNALTADRQALVEVPVAVALDDVPATVRQGSVVDVWVAPQTATTVAKPADAERVFDDVVVVSAPRAADSLAPSGTRQIIIGVTAEQADDLGPALGRLAVGRALIAKQG